MRIYERNRAVPIYEFVNIPFWFDGTSSFISTIAQGDSLQSFRARVPQFRGRGRFLVSRPHATLERKRRVHNWIATCRVDEKGVLWLTKLVLASVLRGFCWHPIYNPSERVEVYL